MWANSFVWVFMLVQVHPSALSFSPVAAIACRIGSSVAHVRDICMHYTRHVGICCNASSSTALLLALDSLPLAFSPSRSDTRRCAACARRRRRQRRRRGRRLCGRVEARGDGGELLPDRPLARQRQGRGGAGALQRGVAGERCRGALKGVGVAALQGGAGAWGVAGAAAGRAGVGRRRAALQGGGVIAPWSLARGRG